MSDPVESATIAAVIKRLHQAHMNLEASNDNDLESILAFCQKRISETTDPIVKEFYHICFNLHKYCLVPSLDPSAIGGKNRKTTTKIKTLLQQAPTALGYKEALDVIFGQYDRFEPQDHQLIRSLLNVFIDIEEMGRSISIEEPLNKEISPHLIRKMYEIGLSIFPPYQLFSAIHEYDVVGTWDSAVANEYIPHKLYLEYRTWKRNKEEFITTCATRNRLAALRDDIEIVLGRFSDRLRDLKIESPDKHIREMHPVVALGVLRQEIDESFQSRGYSSEEIENIFEKLLKEGKFPGVTYEMYQTWKADPTVFEQEAHTQGYLADRPITVPLAEMTSPIQVIDPILADPRVEYINVYYPLVISGNRDQSMGYSLADNDINPGIMPNQGDDFQDRTKTLLKVLLRDAKSGVKKITVRWDRRNAKNDAIEERPYNLIDIEMQDGSLSRVAVCEYKDHMTYIERDAAKITDEKTLQIRALRASRKVWTAVHVNNKQWCERIQEVLYTPVESLTPELKSRSYWHGLKGVLTETFAATIMATGNIPSGTDNRIVEHGPLAGRTTYSRMYGAANSGAVAGLDKGTTFKKLFAQLSSGPMPELAQFMNRKPLLASDIADAWENIKETFGHQATINEYATLIEVDHRDNRAIDLAFQFGAVQGIDKDRMPKNLVAFLRLIEQENPVPLAA